MIPQDFIQSLLARVDIVDVVDRYVKLKKAGANFSACCPFHNEKTPSFTVSPSKQFYHCFGCGVHGNAIGFLMEYSGQSYPDAIRSLAETVGMQVPESSGRDKPSPQVTGLTERMNQALDYYRAQLKKSPTAIAYLKGRGLSGEIAARYGLGYAPDGWQNLEAIFPDYAAGPLKDTGLVIDKEAEEAGIPSGAGTQRKARRYDRFRDRVMFPILDSRGNVIGFGGRVIGQGEPKYLNSPETPLFEKGRELYGLYQARRAIRDANEVIVVEGYMDVVALAQHGVENAVATLGTATTPFHVAKLLKLADNVVFCFDGDAAGRKAAWRALEVSLPVLADGKVVAFLFLPPEDDPDTFVRREAKAGWEKALGEAKPLSQFLFAELTARVDMATDEGRARFLAQAKPLVAQIEAPALSALLRRRLAELARLEEEEIAGLIPARAPPRPGTSGPRPQARTVRKATPLEAKLLACILHRPALAGRIPAAVLDAGKGQISETLAVVTRFFAEDPRRTFAQASAYFEGTEHAAGIEEYRLDPLLNQADSPDLDIQSEVDALIERLQAEVFSRRSRELLQRVDAGEASPAEEAEFASLLKWLEVEKSGNPMPEERSQI